LPCNAVKISLKVYPVCIAGARAGPPDRAKSRYPRLAVLVDVETTGLNHSHNEVIEIGAVAFTYADTGMIGDVVGVFSALRQPSGPYRQRSPASPGSRTRW
jgi:DNA polymerase III epsilon subunit-like protein